jgi:8-oxo-dGTP pyrophosphatase MutT (NUDIX family)
MSDFPDDPAPWKVLTREYLSRNPWNTVRVDRVELPTGAIIPEYFVSEYRPWVNVVALTPDDQVLLVRQYRHGLGQVHYELPAGTTDAGETSLEGAARRELLEETGYGGGRWSPFMTLSANPALQDNLTYTFLAEDVVRLAAPHTEAGEDLRLHPVPAADIERLLDAGEIVQALHAAPLARYVLKRRSR